MSASVKVQQVPSSIQSSESENKAMSNVVKLNRLTKTYGSVTAVNDVSFALDADKIYGLLGRNGAGKTTIMQLLTAQIFPTSGDVQVFGEHPYENSRVLSQVCFIKESQKYPNNLRVRDVLDLSARFFPNWDQDYALTLVKDFRLPLERKMKALSRGMLSSAGIIVGLASRAPLTIFDEPYLGLDAVARSIFYDRLIADYADHPRTIILSTHLIDEVSRLLEHVLVIDQGRLILDVDADSLRGRAFTVIGAASQVESYMEGKALLNREPLGSLVSATVMGNGDAGDRKQAEALGLELAPVSLQKLIVHLTSETSERKAAEVR
ncbi:MAG TPA: ABC transporter ATP-binding protein [Ktedonobacterales bacterium]|jgi:ABC-2 type transport system ATP-binding protein